MASIRRNVLTTDATSLSLIPVEEYKRRHIVKSEREKFPNGLKDRVYNYTKAICFVIDHYTFENNEHPIRLGTEYDSAGLEEVFTEMQFEVRPLKDKTKQQLFDTLEQFAKSTKPEDYCDLLVVSILTHGSKTSLAAFDRMYDLDELFDLFYADKCPRLSGKAKIFIINACAGQKLTRVVEVEQSKEKMYSDEMIAHSLPVTADFLVAMSTVSNYVSIRETLYGSWFIQCLITTLFENIACETRKDFVSLLDEVKHRIAVNNEYEAIDPKTGIKFRQMPIVNSTLRGKVYIPGAEVRMQ